MKKFFDKHKKIFRLLRYVVLWLVMVVTGWTCFSSDVLWSSAGLSDFEAECMIVGGFWGIFCLCVYTVVDDIIFYVRQYRRKRTSQEESK